MDMSTEDKSAAAKFMNLHERISQDLENHKFKVTDLERTLDQRNATIAAQLHQIELLTRDKNTYLQYSFELAAQLTFMVAGSAKALKTANAIRQRMAEQGTNAEDVSDGDVAELTELLGRIEPAVPAKATATEMLVSHAMNGAPPPMTMPPVMMDQDGRPMPPHLKAVASALR